MAEYGVVLAVITALVFGALSLLSGNIISAIHSGRRLHQLAPSLTSMAGGPFAARRARPLTTAPGFSAAVLARTRKREPQSHMHSRTAFRSEWAVAGGVFSGPAAPRSPALRDHPVRHHVQPLHHVDGCGSRRRPNGGRLATSTGPRRRYDRQGADAATDLTPSDLLITVESTWDAGDEVEGLCELPLRDQVARQDDQVRPNEQHNHGACRMNQRGQSLVLLVCLDRPGRNGRPSRRRRLVVPRRPETAGERRCRGARRRTGAAGRHSGGRSGPALDYAERTTAASKPRTSSSARPSSPTTRSRSPQDRPSPGSFPSCSAELPRRARDRIARVGCSAAQSERPRSRSTAEHEMLRCNRRSPCWGSYQTAFRGRRPTIDFFKVGPGRVPPRQHRLVGGRNRAPGHRRLDPHRLPRRLPTSSSGTTRIRNQAELVPRQGRARLSPRRRAGSALHSDTTRSKRREPASSTTSSASPCST